MGDMFDMGAVLNAYTAGRQNRTQQMLLQRQIAREDKQLEREDAIRSVYARLKNPQPKGGDQPAAAPVTPSIAAPYSEPVVETPRTGVEGRPIDRTYPQGSPLSADVFKPPVLAQQSQQPAEATRQPHPSFTNDPPPSWLAENESLINELMALDPKEAFGLRETLSKMDDQQLEKAAMRNAELAKAAMHLSSFGSPQAQQAELQRIAPSLMAHGITPQEIQNFELTPQNLQWVQVEALDLEKVIAREKADREFNETVRHNRETEKNAAAGIEVRRGALSLAQKREGRIGSGGGGGGSSNDDLNYLIGGN